MIGFAATKESVPWTAFSLGKQCTEIGPARVGLFLRFRSEPTVLLRSGWGSTFIQSRLLPTG